ncbi:4Fe-4S ferredoxin|uniref:Ferredoxin like protein n=1 Tax=Dendrosporobacter quercicolus TaxID=146817 RepID=A0A1G9UZN2_9FIRM|nr:4Fe-4S ferredoxin [Dendrosporobacter quercicolus]NSL47975.1 4Fe-4S ferredoxin [Dendrosporobacter quercicolus DSM 1736]SDM65323.1 ferredoxin like protein [Dendrosporobacter quercicolus]
MNKLDYWLGLLHFTPDEQHQHICIADPALCQDCRDKPCLTFCPVGVFSGGQTDSQPVAVCYRQCLECGACRLICPNIDFSYPRNGCGVEFREG